MKKVLYFLSIFTILTVFIPHDVKAYILTAQDIVNDIDKSLISENEKVVANGNKFEYYYKDELVDSYDMSKGYIECYNDIFTEPGNEAKGIILVYLDLYVPFTDTSFDIVDEYKDYYNFSKEKKDSIFDKYGIYFENVTVDDEEKVLIKVTFDIDKLDKLFLETRVIKNDLSENEKQSLYSTPDLLAEDIKKNEITLFPHNTIADLPEEYNYCYVYRSTKIDGEYVKLPGKMIKCNGEYAIIDDTLEPNTTYYYKARAMYTNVLSDPIEVTTLKGKTITQNANTDEKTTTTKVPDNPKTGLSSHIFATVLISVLGIISMLILRKNKVFGQL